MICPTEDTIRKWLAGKLDETSADAIADHLDNCNSCQVVVESCESRGDLGVGFLQELALSDENLETHAGQTYVPENNQQLQTIGNYVLTDRIGGGGMGDVFRAHHSRFTHRQYAVKLLKAELATADGFARFEREIQLMGKLSHDNLVFAIDAGRQGAKPYLVMEFVPGRDLNDLVHIHGRLPINAACEIVRQACVGIQYAHDHGVIHRDLKPANILLTHEGTVKVVDLGLASLRDGSGKLTTDMQIMGTPAYMAPEQWRSAAKTTSQTDVYALGCTLYCLLTGKSPFGWEGQQLPAALMRGHLETIPLPAQRRRGEIPEELSETVGAALRKDFVSRISSAAEFARRLSPFCAGADLPGLLGTALLGAASGIRQDENRYHENLLREKVAGHDRHSFAMESTEQKNLRALGSKVQRFWIEGVLGHSTGEHGLLPIAKLLRPNAVYQPWREIVPFSEDEVAVIPPDLDMADVFAESDHSLLLLGTPGSGKTTALLELLHLLLEKFNAGVMNEVPVVFHLASWQPRELALADWVEQELSSKYQIPRRIGRSWLAQDRLILLLDGLDEVPPRLQPECVAALNSFLAEHGVPGIVVCSRLEDYHKLPHKLSLTAALELQPLSEDQVLTFLGNRCGNLRSICESDDKLRNLACSPLMLNVMATGLGESESTLKIDTDSQASDATAISDGSVVIDRYVDRLLRREKESNRFSQKQTTTSLSWLARTLEAQNRTMFLVEEIQPSWLASLSERIVYLAALSALLGTTTAAVAALAWWGCAPIMDVGTESSYRSLVIMFLQFPIWYFGIGAADFLLPVGNRRTGKMQKVVQGLSKAAIYLGWWSLWPFVGWWMGSWSASAITTNMLFGVFSSLYFGSLGAGYRLILDVRTVESLRFSWRSSLQGGLWGLAGGFLVYLAYLLLWACIWLPEIPAWFPQFWLVPEELFVSVAYPLIGGVIGFIVAGMTPQILAGKTVANQGMVSSARNAIFAGAVAMPILAVAAFALVSLWLMLPDNNESLSNARIFLLAGSFGIWTGFHVALWFGALDVLKHAFLRIILFTAGRIPLRLTPFLQHATRLGILHQVGGSFIFAHRLLLEHFARKTQ